METNDGNGRDGGPKKRRAPGARKRAPKAARAAEQSAVGSTEREAELQTAYDVKDVHRALASFSDDDLKQIPIVPTGTHLEQGATYIDLAEERPSEVKVNAGVIARAGHYYVPKNRVPYTIWNRLIGEEKPGQEWSGVTDRTAAEAGGTPGRGADRTPAEVTAGGAESFAASGAEQRGSEVKSWIDTRPEDRETRGEVL